MKKKLVLALGVLTVLITVSSCKKFKDIDETEIKELNDALNKSDVQGAFGRGASEKFWANYSKDCFNSGTFKKGVFAGYSNSIQLGDFRKRDGGASYSLSNFKLTKADSLELFKTPGNLADGCSSDRKKVSELGVELGAKIINVANLGLKSLFTRRDSIVLTSKEFIQYDLNVDAMNALIEKTPQLLTLMKDKKNRYVSQIIKCRASSFDIYLNNSIVDSLGGALDKGILEKINLADGTANVLFKRKSAKVVSAHVDREFTLIMRLMKRI